MPPLFIDDETLVSKVSFFRVFPFPQATYFGPLLLWACFTSFLCWAASYGIFKSSLRSRGSTSFLIIANWIFSVHIYSFRSGWPVSTTPPYSLFIRRVRFFLPRFISMEYEVRGKSSVLDLLFVGARALRPLSPINCSDNQCGRFEFPRSSLGNSNRCFCVKFETNSFESCPSE